MILNLQQLTEAASKTKDIDVPELGGTVRLGLMRPKDGMKLAMALQGVDINDLDVSFHHFIETLALSIIDETGALSCNSPEGRATLEKLPLGVIMLLGQEAMNFNGLTRTEDQKKT